MMNEPLYSTNEIIDVLEALDASHFIADNPLAANYRDDLILALGIPYILSKDILSKEL